MNTNNDDPDFETNSRSTNEHDQVNGTASAMHTTQLQSDSADKLKKPRGHQRKKKTHEKSKEELENEQRFVSFLFI